MEIDLGKLDDLSPEQQEILTHILVIERLREQEVGMALLRQNYYATWGPYGNARNQ